MQYYQAFRYINGTMVMQNYGGEHIKHAQSCLGMSVTRDFYHSARKFCILLKKKKKKKK